MDHRHRLLRLVASMAMLTSSITFAQIDTPVVPPDHDTRDLYRRIVASRLVAKGTVVLSRAVGQRIPAKDIEALRRSLDDPVAGYLYTIRLDEIFYRGGFGQGDNASEAGQSGSAVQVFVPRGHTIYSGGYREEGFLRNRQYFVFLVEAEPAQQQHWIQTLELSSNYRYYRALGYSRGVVALSEATHGQPTPVQPPLLKLVAHLCSALSMPTQDARLSALQALADSGDPVLQREAGIAIRDLRGDHQ